MKVLKFLTIIYTLIIILFLFVFFFDFKLLVINLDNFTIIGLLTFHWVLKILYFRDIYKNSIINKKTKIDNSLMILFLGIIGMWLYLPKNRENAIQRNLTTRKSKL